MNTKERELIRFHDRQGEKIDNIMKHLYPINEINNPSDNTPLSCEL